MRSCTDQEQYESFTYLLTS